MTATRPLKEKSIHSDQVKGLLAVIISISAIFIFTRHTTDIIYSYYQFTFVLSLASLYGSYRFALQFPQKPAAWLLLLSVVLGGLDFMSK